jgi:hypothetical protein
MYAVSVQEELIPAAFPTPEVEHEHAHYGVGSDHAEKLTHHLRRLTLQKNLTKPLKQRMETKSIPFKKSKTGVTKSAAAAAAASGRNPAASAIYRKWSS